MTYNTKYIFLALLTNANYFLPFVHDLAGDFCIETAVTSTSHEHIAFERCRHNNSFGSILNNNHFVFEALYQEPRVKERSKPGLCLKIKTPSFFPTLLETIRLHELKFSKLTKTKTRGTYCPLQKQKQFSFLCATFICYFQILVAVLNDTCFTVSILPFLTIIWVSWGHELYLIQFYISVSRILQQVNTGYFTKLNEIRKPFQNHKCAFTTVLQGTWNK